MLNAGEYVGSRVQRGELLIWANHARLALAATGFGLALLALTALVVAPDSIADNFRLFMWLLIGSTVLVPEWPWRVWRQAPPWKPVTALALGVLAWIVVPIRLSGHGWDGVDNIARLLLLPWCAGLAYVLKPSRLWLWCGALAGIASALAIALWQAGNGVARADGWGNPLVFANAVMVLTVLAVYCRPGGTAWGKWLAGLAVTAGIAAIVLSGSRGVLPGIGVMLLVAVLLGRRDRFRPRLGLMLLALAIAALSVATVPWLSAQTRLDDARTDIARYRHGDSDSAIGARLELLAISARAIEAHPWSGVGLRGFKQQVERQRECRLPAPPQWCELRHAHNDVAQWGATLGVPGIVMILSLYLVPLWLFVRQGLALRDQGAIGPAWAGALLVAALLLSGLTQSIFAHATTASLFSALVGALLGLAWRESGDAQTEAADER